MGKRVRKDDESERVLVYVSGRDQTARDMVSSMDCSMAGRGRRGRRGRARNPERVREMPVGRRAVARARPGAGACWTG